MSEVYNETDNTLFRKSTITTPAKIPADSVINQYQPILTSSSVLNSNITYTEPITSKLAVTFNYGLGMNNSVSDRESYNQSSTGRYDVFDPIYSNNYKFNQLTNQLGALFNYRGTKDVLTFGTKASGVDFKQIDQFTGKAYKRSFVNWSPQAVYQYRITTSSNFYLSYNGSATQPTIDQIQPIRVNTDPLNIIIGNINLEPQFRHNFSTNYRISKSLSAQTLSFNGSYSFTTNTITSNINFDPVTGKRTTQYVNITDKNPYNYSLRASASRKIIGVTTELNLSSTGSTNYTFSNSVLSKNTNQTYNASIYLQRSEAKKYGISISGGPSYTFAKYDLQPNSNNNYSGYN